MSLERIGLFFKTGSVDRHVASLAAIDARYRLIEAITVKLIERHLLNLGNLVGTHRTELERRVFHHPDPFVPLRRHLGEFVFDFLGAGLDLFYFFL